MPSLDRSIVDQHEQKYCLSCIPSCVELVLKLLGNVDGGYFGLQDEWQNRRDGSFGQFNGRQLFGLRFQNVFTAPRGAQFPLADLFQRIDEELALGRFVMISLQSAGGWHMYVIHDRRNGEYLSVSKLCHQTINENRVKALVTAMGGTDILVYAPAGGINACTVCGKVFALDATACSNCGHEIEQKTVVLNETILVRDELSVVATAIEELEKLAYQEALLESLRADRFQPETQREEFLRRGLHALAIVADDLLRGVADQDGEVAMVAQGLMDRLRACLRRWRRAFGMTEE